MSTSEKIREALAEKGITNGRMLADYLGSEGVIFFVRGTGGWDKARAELRYKEDGKEKRRNYRPKEFLDVRYQCVADAQDDAAELLGIESWSKAPFSNCWLPSEDVSKVHEEFDPQG